MKLSKVSRTTLRVATIVAFTAVIVGAIIDKVRFDYGCRTTKAVSSELGGHPYSIGGWPLGMEYVMRFDHMLTDDELRHLATATPATRRIHLTLYFNTDVSDARLASMQRIVAPHGITITASSGGDDEKDTEQH